MDTNSYTEIDQKRVIKFIQTSELYPEQYDAFDANGKQVGYLRLDGGVFEVRFPDPCGEIIYEAHPRGHGDFMDNEREHYLKEAELVILSKLKA